MLFRSSSKIKDNDYFLNDGGGLRLKVTTTGKKIWQFRYTFNNKRKLTSFKTYPIVNLKEAREKRQDFQELLNKNIDPIDYYKNLKSENILDENGMFLNVAQEWLKKEEKKQQPQHILINYELLKKTFTLILKISIFQR